MLFVLEITAEHLADPRTLGRHLPKILNAIGNLQPHDLGKRVYEVENDDGARTIYQVENDEQRNKRWAPWKGGRHAR
jgi:hypothetical protein